MLTTQQQPTTIDRIHTTSETMRAAVYDDYGNANMLYLTELPIPARKPGELRIEVKATSINPIDYRLRRGEMRALLWGGFPRIPGYDVAGVVAECDHESPFEPGDRVMAFLDSTRGGAAAEYANCGVGVTAKIPDSMPFDEAAAAPLAGTTALQSLRDHGNIKPGQRVLINGASGGVGMFAVQIAKSYHCQVDAVASDDNREFCLALGADNFYDYEQTDYTKTGEQWDLIFDAAGKSSYWDARRALTKQGRFVSTEPNVRGMLTTLVSWPLSKSATVMLAKPNGDDLRELITLYQIGKLNITIDTRYLLADIVKAHRRLEEGVDRGKVVVLTGQHDESIKHSQKEI